MKKMSVCILLLSCFGFLHAQSDSDDDGKTALYRAVDNEDIKEALRLINNGADINEPNPLGDMRWTYAGATPIYAAVDNEDIKMTEFLLKNGARVDISTVHEGTVLHAAARRGNTRIYQLLLDAGCDINAVYTDKTAYRQEGSTGTALHLLTDQTLYNFYEDHSPFLYTRRYDALVFLIELGADLNISRPEDGQTVLHMSIREEVDQVFNLFLDSGADVNAVDRNGETPLMHAVRKGRKDYVETLIAQGAEIDAENEDGQTALALAKRYYEYGIRNYLIDHGADTNHPSVYESEAAVWEDFTDNTFEFLSYSAISLIYTCLSIGMYEFVYRDTPDQNWMAGVNAYAVSISACTLAGALIGGVLWPEEDGFLGGLAKIIGVFIGGAVGFAGGIAISMHYDLPRAFRENRGLYYLGPAISLTVPIVMLSW